LRKGDSEQYPATGIEVLLLDCSTKLIDEECNELRSEPLLAMLGTAYPVVCNGELDASLDSSALDRDVADLIVCEGILRHW
jgi:hypothetical protein